MDNKKFFELSRDEIMERSALTHKEKAAIDAFIAAARALPKSLCIDLHDDRGEPNLTVSKRITRGSCQRVAELRKKSLCF